MFLAPLPKSKTKNEGVNTQSFQWGRKKWREQRECSLNEWQSAGVHLFGWSVTVCHKHSWYTLHCSVPFYIYFRWFSSKLLWSKGFFPSPVLVYLTDNSYLHKRHPGLWNMPLSTLLALSKLSSVGRVDMLEFRSAGTTLRPKSFMLAWIAMRTGMMHWEQYPQQVAEKYCLGSDRRH